jgi:hypothetical protein
MGQNLITAGLLMLSDMVEYKSSILSMSNEFCKGCVRFHHPDTVVSPREKVYSVLHWPVQPLLLVTSIEDYISYNPTLTSSSCFFFPVVEMENSGTCF